MVFTGYIGNGGYNKRDTNSKQIAMCAIHCFYSSSLSASPTPLLLFSKDEHVIISMCTCKLHKNCEPYMKKTGRDNRSPTAIQPPETHIWSCVRLNRMCLFSVDRVFGSYSNMTVVFPVWCTSWWCFCVGALNFAMRYDWLYCEILPYVHKTPEKLSSMKHYLLSISVL